MQKNLITHITYMFAFLLYNILPISSISFSETKRTVSEIIVRNIWNIYDHIDSLNYNNFPLYLLTHIHTNLCAAYHTQHFYGLTALSFSDPSNMFRYQ